MAVQFISVIGSSPGVGKSTLCRSLAKWLAQGGAAVDHFEEADILTRPAFRTVAQEFADGASSVQPKTLVGATRAYVADSQAAGMDYVVTDALLPYIPSLVAWGHQGQELVGIMTELTRAVEPARVTVVYVHDDPSAALDRAVAREGEAWAQWYVDKLAGAPGTRSVHDLPSAAAHLRREAELTHRLLAQTSWPLVTVDAGTYDAKEAFASARRQLADKLGLSEQAVP